MKFSWKAALPTSAFAGLIALSLTGCPAPAEKADDTHDHTDEHDHAVPTTLAGAQESLEHMGEEIKTAFEAGKPDEAHDALHDIGLVIQAVPELAADLGEQAKADAKQVHDDLMAAYMKLDDTMHGGTEATWDDVSEQVDSAMAKLESLITEGEDHAHDDHAHAHAHDHEDDHEEEDHDHEDH